MCGVDKAGVPRRCLSRQHYAATAAANRNRRTSRQARRRVAEHLRDVGLPNTASALMSTPPSAIPALLRALDIDGPAVLGDIRMPDDRRRAVAADKLIAQARAEAAYQQQPTAKPVVVTRHHQPPDTAAPRCRTRLDTVVGWERRAETAFDSTGSTASARAARAEAAALCRHCPLIEACTATARKTRYTGIAGGHIFIDGRHRTHPSRPPHTTAAA